MVILRDYQQSLHDRVRASMEANRRAPLIVSPCGSGKTVMFCDYAQKTNAKHKKVIILSHRDELIEQISDTLKLFDVKHSFIAAGHPYHADAPTQVASVMSLARRLNSIPKPDLVIIDEAHHAVAGSWLRVLNHWSSVRRIGVTATACRLSGEPLAGVFDDLIIGPTAGELITHGALSPYRIIAPRVEWPTVGHTAGDFTKSALAKAKNRRTITGDAVANYTKHAGGKRAVAFCVNIDDAKEVAVQFQSAGYRAASIDGTMNRGERKKLVQMFRQGFIDVLTTCDLISEGFDLPAIECAIMLRPTESLALWIQQFGRALRLFPGKDRAIILDHVGNTVHHGWLPESEVEWSLDGRVRVKSSVDSGPSVRVCAFCGTAQFNVGGVQMCKECGTLFSTAGAEREVKRVEGELEEMSADDLARIAKAKRIEQGMANTFAELVELGRKRKMSDPVGWASNVWASRETKRKAAEAYRRRQEELSL